MNPQIKIVPTEPFREQRPGTSGLRKKTRRFMEPRYLENFVQSAFDSLRAESGGRFGNDTLVLGGDGRFYNREAIQIILRLAIANGFGRVLVARGGILSTPAMSAVIRRRGASGGFVLSASHNPGGIDADFGIKYNIRNGGPAPETLTESIYHRTLKVDRYLDVDLPPCDIDREQSFQFLETEVSVVNPYDDYTALMEELFDFDLLSKLFREGFRMLFDAMHGVTGPYASLIFEKKLGAGPGSVLHGIPLEDFGGHHPDPNLAHARALVEAMSKADAPDLGAACDGDGDRNMILGPEFYVTPGDSLAVIADLAAHAIPGYRSGLAGVARSMPTSRAVDRVAARLGIPCHETPTGWKFFGNLMDAGLCTLCGEESFGTGSSHIREKDGLWAVLCWLSILACTRKSVRSAVEDHWSRYGRSYFQRHDYEGLDPKSAGEMLAALRAELPALEREGIAGSVIELADDFCYTDPVDHSVSISQGIRLVFRDGSRIVFRLSGTGTEGATLRLYLERYQIDDSHSPVDEVLRPLVRAAREIVRLRECCGRTEPTLKT